jgi:hypothetical protein
MVSHPMPVAEHTIKRPSGWHPGVLGILLIGASDFAAAVGVGNLWLGRAALRWLLLAGVLLLAAIAAGE